MASSSFENVFSSHTRSKTLLSLANFTESVCVNELAELTNCSLCSVHAAVKDLFKDKILQGSRQQNETKYCLNKSSASFDLIMAIKVTNERQTIRQRAHSYSKKAQQSLKFIADSHRLISKVKKPYDN